MTAVELPSATNPDPHQLLDIDDLATLLKVSRKWVEKEVAGERLPFTRLGVRMVRFSRAQVAEIIATHANRSAAPLPPQIAALTGITGRRTRGRKSEVA